jgi:hypothetical protein
MSLPAGERDKLSDGDLLSGRNWTCNGNESRRGCANDKAQDDADKAMHSVFPSNFKSQKERKYTTIKPNKKDGRCKLREKNQRDMGAG